MLERLCWQNREPTERNASSFGCVELVAALQTQRPRSEGLNTGEGLAEARAARDQPSKGLTLELSGGEAVRFERVVRPAKARTPTEAREAAAGWNLGR
jgi:hypothetical protein